MEHKSLDIDLQEHHGFMMDHPPATSSLIEKKTIQATTVKKKVGPSKVLTKNVTSKVADGEQPAYACNQCHTSLFSTKTAVKSLM